MATVEQILESIACTGPSITAEAALAAALDIGAPIPDSYAEFLARCNGGRLADRLGLANFAIDDLLGFRNDGELSLGSGVQEFSIAAHVALLPPCRRPLLPIATTFFAELLCLEPGGSVVALDPSADSERPTRLHESFEAFLAALRPPEPDVALALYLQGKELRAKGEFDVARETLLASWEKRPHAATAHQLGSVLWELGDSEAGKWLRWSHRGNERQSLYATTYADWLAQEGRVDDASEILRRVLARNADYAPARRLLDGLKQDC